MINSGINTEGEKAGQEFNHVICDVTSIIVDDGVTLHPGYIEVKDGKVIAHFSDDPNNKQNPFLMNDKGEATGKNPNFSLGMLTNRVEFRFTEVLDALESEVAALLEGMHFISTDVMNFFIEKLAAKKEEAPIEETKEPEELDTAPEIVDDTVMDETPVVEETTETPTEEVAEVTETPTEEEIVPETAVEEETAPEVEETPEEVAPIDDTTTDEPIVEETSTDEPASEDAVEETPTEVEEPVAESAEPAGAHLIDVGGIQRCSVCMLTAGAIGGEEEIANHMAAHDGTAAPAVEAEPTGGMMTTETSI